MKKSGSNAQELTGIVRKARQGGAYLMLAPVVLVPVSRVARVQVTRVQVTRVQVKREAYLAGWMVDGCGRVFGG